MKEESFLEKYGIKKADAKAGEEVQVLKYKSYADLIKGEAGKKDTITFGTSIIGRGTTIKTNDDIDEKGRNPCYS